MTKWETLDDGFLDVVKGLRSIAINLQHPPASVEQEPPVSIKKPPRRWPLVAGVVVLVLACAGGRMFWQQHQRAQAGEYVAQGDALLNRQQWDAAEKAYQHAQELDPDNAKAFFGLGTLYDLERNPEAATQMYERAVQLSPTPEYRSNLADQYFKSGQYKRAIVEYARIDEFPLAALEHAKISRLMSNGLDEALEYNQVTIRWLNDASISNRPENKLPWYFIADKKSIWMETPPEKLCYAQFELSVTLSLKGNDTDARKYADAGRQSCGERLRDIEAELSPELQRLANERPELAARSAAYLHTFFGS